MSRNIFAIGSVTHAMKAQYALSQKAVLTKVIKLDSSMTKKGCAYGLEIPASQKGYARRILDGAGIEYEEYDF